MLHHKNLFHTREKLAIIDDLAANSGISKFISASENFLFAKKKSFSKALNLLYKFIRINFSEGS